MIRFFFAVLISLGLAFPAAAQMACGDRTDILTSLEGKYEEAPVAMGLSNTGGVIEVLSSPEGNTWTIIMTDPNGLSCLIAAGEYWEAAKKIAAGEKI